MLDDASEASSPGPKVLKRMCICLFSRIFGSLLLFLFGVRVRRCAPGSSSPDAPVAKGSVLETGAFLLAIRYGERQENLLSVISKKAFIST